MKKLFLFISLLILTQISLGQEIIQDNQKPKIGLVLSGGGAKGLAHIGVLKVIDSLGIKVDYIGGTSMGAIIGGLYASGYSGKELDSIFNNVNTEALVQDFIPRNAKNFYEKRNDEIYALTLPFNKFKIGLPIALSKGMYNFNLMSRLTKHVSHIKEFKNLYIPFFCIATDIETGREIILDSGNLPKALIASGAIPSLYNPIEIDNMILVDGGVVNNFPIEELKQRGVDLVIGVDVQDGLRDRESLKGATDVLAQITNMNTIKQMEKKIKLTDIYIKPNIEGFSVLSFESGKEIIDNGTKAAIETLSNASKIYPTLSKKVNNEIKAIKPTDSIFIKEISIQNLKNYTRSYVIGKLMFKPNSWVTFNKIEKGINNLSGTQNFKSIFYEFQSKREGEESLVVSLEENKTSSFIKFGAHYDELFKTNVLVNYTNKKILTKNDILSIDAIFGDNFRYNFNYQIDNGFHWSFGFNSKLLRFNRNIKNDFNNGTTLTNLSINSINIDYSDWTNQIYLQTIFAQKFSIGAGVEIKKLKIDSQTVLNTTPLFENSNYFSIFGYLKYDSFDNKYFPKSGWFFNGETKSFLYSSDYNNNFENFIYAKADMGFVVSFNKKFTLKVQTEGGFHVGENTINFFDFALGGYGFTTVNNLRPFYGYDFISLTGDSYVKADFTLDYEFYKKHHFNLASNYANIGNKIFENLESWFSQPQFSGYQLGYGYESIIGPIEIKTSWSPETHNQYTWFSVGFWF